MKKILLLTVAMLSATTAYSMCVPPNLPKCKCQFPKFENRTLSCGEDYCEKEGKKCMDDGSCCEILDDEGSSCCDLTGKNKITGLCCDVSTIENCSTGIIDDETTGCKKCCPVLESEGCETETAENGCTVCKVADFETVCRDAEGSLLNWSMGPFCRTPSVMLWQDAKNWCEQNGMLMVPIKKICSSYYGLDAVSDFNFVCEELKEIEAQYFWTSTLDKYAYHAVGFYGGNGNYGSVSFYPIDEAIMEPYRVYGVCMEKD